MLHVRASILLQIHRRTACSRIYTEKESTHHEPLLVLIVVRFVMSLNVSMQSL